MAEPTAEPICQTIELRLTGQPTVNYRWGSGSIRPDRVILTYLDDRRLAHLYGSWIREDGEQTDDRVDQLYRHDDAWPDWLTVLARKHAPAAPVSPPVSRAAVLREAADIAESLRQFERCTGPRRAAQTSENVGVLRVADLLRRMAAEAQQQCGCGEPSSPGTVHRGDGPCYVDEEQQQPTTVDKAAALGMTDTEYRAHSHRAAMDVIRAAVPGLYASVALRVEDALAEAQQQPDTETRARPTCTCNYIAEPWIKMDHARDCPARPVTPMDPVNILGIKGAAPAVSGPRAADDEQDDEAPTQLTPCTCRQTIHAQEHKGRTVPDCPWCTPDPDIRPNRPTPGHAANVVTLPDHTVDEEAHGA